jgi:hypothetical protein
MSREELNEDATELLGGRFAACMLIKLELTEDVCVATCRDTIEWDGNTFLGGRSIGVDRIKDSSGEVQGLRFGISGVPVEYLSIALQEPIQGKRVRCWLAIMHPDTQAIVDVVQLWAGTLDQMPYRHGQTATISVTAEHRGMTFSRPKPVRYTDGDQQRLYPGDKCLEFLVSQSTHRDVWPAAAFYRQ